VVIFDKLSDHKLVIQNIADKIYLKQKNIYKNKRRSTSINTTAVNLLQVRLIWLSK